MPLLGDDDTDATEYSSSFGDTSSTNENALAMSDAEVQSEFHDDNSCYSALHLRKKKVSSHWRRFIHPLAWRCKWTELRVKELERQAVIYSQEITENGERKFYQVEQLTSELCSKSFPFFSDRIQTRVLKRRRRRKQVEKMTDLTSYMSHHQLFSYLENKSWDVDGAGTADDISSLDPSFVIDDLGTIMDNCIQDGDNGLEDVLSDIERIHSRIHGLRTHLEKVMFKSGVKVSSSHWENLSMVVPYHMPAGSANNSPVLSAEAGNGGDALSVSAVFEIGNLVIPEIEIEISSHEEATHVPDIIESSTLDLLSAADVDADAHHPQSHTL
ncbi:hypothetical protein Dimus_000670 [Dionaea muscipula]